jgi:hypothetical protein
VCGAVEDDAHLFFRCQLPRVVWFFTSPPLRTDNLPQDNDGVQLILQTVIPTSITDDLLIKILTTMWYIWKARNDNRFQRKTWTPWQVHHAMAAHTSAHQEALQQQPIQNDPPIIDGPQQQS